MMTKCSRRIQVAKMGVRFFRIKPEWEGVKS